MPPPCARRNSRNSHCPRFLRSDNVLDLSPYQHSGEGQCRTPQLNRRRDAQWNIACQPLMNMNIRVTCLGGKNFENSGTPPPPRSGKQISLLTWKEVIIFLCKDSHKPSLKHAPDPPGQIHSTWDSVDIPRGIPQTSHGLFTLMLTCCTLRHWHSRSNTSERVPSQVVQRPDEPLHDTIQRLAITVPEWGVCDQLRPTLAKPTLAKKIDRLWPTLIDRLWPKFGWPTLANFSVLRC